MAGWIHDPHQLPDAPGAYVLRMTFGFPAPLPPRFAGTHGPVLAPGTYLYCGSARGGGGLRARCARHLAADKPRRWHVDWLTTAAGDTAVWPVAGGDECALRGALTVAGAAVPVPGFGSSDCRRCPSHLLRWPDAAADVTPVLAGLPDGG
ncbi:DUF123 domain-containing protein [Caenispirillum salinarum]|uniref:GIY-YIG nuclease family protein n=1 Tax=Caenispirillum salinarum TaxID=859058 RepID=UPI00384EBB91